MVRGCHRHVSLLNDLLNKADEGHLVDPTLIHYSFAFCASHVHGNRFFIRFNETFFIIKILDQMELALLR